MVVINQHAFQRARMSVDRREYRFRLWQVAGVDGERGMRAGEAGGCPPFFMGQRMCPRLVFPGIRRLRGESKLPDLRDVRGQDFQG